MFQESSCFGFINCDWILDFIGNRNVRVNVINQPPKWLAIQSLSKLNLLGNVAKVSLRVTNSSVIIFLVLIEPNFSKPIGVPTIVFTAFRELNENHFQSLSLN